MPTKSSNLRDDQTREILSVLSAPSVLGLQKICTLLKTHPQSFGSHTTRLESTLLSLINCKEMTCPRQNSVHHHFPPSASVNDKLLCSASACFAMLPLVGNPLRISNRLIDFQMRVLYCLCKSLRTLLDLHGISSPSLQSVDNYLDSKVELFISLKPASRDGIPPPEHMKLLFARVDFFVGCLRSLFESDLNVECQLCLPLFVAFFNGVLSVEQISGKFTTCDLLLRSSRLLNCLAAFIRLVGAKLAPASASLLTLLTYQLEWTAVWNDRPLLNEDIVRHRLASLHCLQETINSVRSFHSHRLIRLLPRILTQLIHDISWASDLHSTANASDDPDQNPPVLVEDIQHKKILPLSLKRRLLAASFELIELIFSDAAVNSTFRLAHHHSSIHPETLENNESVTHKLAKLQFCLSQLSRHITSNFPGGAPFRRHFCSGFQRLPLLHPSVLISFSRCLSTLLLTSMSVSALSAASNFLTELSLHPDPELSSVARNCLQRLGIVLPTIHYEGSLTQQRNSDSATVARTLIDNTPPAVVCVPMVSSRSAILQPYSDELSYTEKETTSGTASSPVTLIVSTDKCEEICAESDRKRRRVSDDVDSSEKSTVLSQIPVPGVPLSHDISVDSCLASFDPTFV
ncbi:hypothetical protein CRM22_008479 [Opisthorchis felineus]|uniref:DUF5742 domain-containing protein n=1 Tax=Opisthorchis felineus TaxID=147828 RepID=A0A4S2LBQ0_OPIFE|nr:hypothetical protein CRM22_008479 [Opisthorchis felineus]TGZ60532.1 hypothetical protein CRM22_008479 [Opisthorchis felineus]